MSGSRGIPVECSACGYQFKVPLDFAGKEGRCPSCKDPVRVPALAEEASPAPSYPTSPDAALSSGGVALRLVLYSLAMALLFMVFAIGSGAPPRSGGEFFGLLALSVVLGCSFGGAKSVERVAQRFPPSYQRDLAASALAGVVALGGFSLFLLVVFRLAGDTKGDHDLVKNLNAAFALIGLPAAAICFGRLRSYSFGRNLVVATGVATAAFAVVTMVLSEGTPSLGGLLSGLGAGVLFVGGATLAQQLLHRGVDLVWRKVRSESSE
jgi:hypothetical protein